MTDNTTLLPLFEKFFENDLSAAAGVLESMSGEEAAGALKSLPIPLAARVVKVLQISYAAELLKEADDHMMIAMTPHLDPQFLATIMHHIFPEKAAALASHQPGDSLSGRVCCGAIRRHHCPIDHSGGFPAGGGRTGRKRRGSVAGSCHARYRHA
jgi:hypothetical protein